MFELYFDDNKIIEQLIRIRLKEAEKRHTAHFFHALTPEAKFPGNIPTRTAGMLPSRKLWLRQRLKDRKGFGRDKINAASIRGAIKRQIQNGGLGKTDWGKKLAAFILEVREAALADKPPGFATPRVFTLKKPGGGCRAVSQLTCLADQVRIALLSRYYRDWMDPMLAKNVFFYRNGWISHHDAVRSLLEFRARHKGKKLYVAECDLSHFFDLIPHNVIRQKLKEMDEERKNIGQAGPLDKRALLQIEGCLAAYSYEDTVLPVLKEQGSSASSIIDELREKGRLSKHDKVGVPQGTPLSMALANLVLHSADKAVLNTNDPELFYARYCDDMILLHTEKAECAKAMKRYINALSELNLVVHEPKKIEKFDKTFYGYKSKLPFVWGPVQPGKSGVSPWVSFLGYQIRFDGAMRIRKESVQREITRQIKMVDEVMHYILKNPDAVRLDKEEILSRVKMRMVASVAGRSDQAKKEGDPAVETAPICWAEGFRMLRGNSFDVSQLKGLDRGHERQWRRLKKRLAEVLPDKTEETHETQIIDGASEGTLQKKKRRKKRKRFFGAPTSYFGRFKHRRSVSSAKGIIDYGS